MKGNIEFLILRTILQIKFDYSNLKNCPNFSCNAPKYKKYIHIIFERKSEILSLVDYYDEYKIHHNSIMIIHCFIKT